jgi:hypothetical protein
MRQFLSIESILSPHTTVLTLHKILRQQYIYRFKNGKKTFHRQDNLPDIIPQLSLKLHTPLIITPRIITLSSPNRLLLELLPIASNQSLTEKGLLKWVLYFPKL